MSTSTLSPRSSDAPPSTERWFYAILAMSALALSPFVLWPRLMLHLLATDFLPHVYC
jgi:hypothetical protein